MGVEVGAFELLEPLARGGMGVVWRARHRSQDVPVAIKVLPPDPNGALARALAHEVRAVASLDHPNVVWIYDHGRLTRAAAVAGLAPDSPWFAMELARGTLSKAPRPWPQVRQVLLGLLDALGHAHARGVLHRDLKPANLLIASDGRLLLSDFGMGLALGQSGDTELSGGTPPYMAPEQFGFPAHTQGPWTDLYALGCLAWALACGTAPFRRRGLAAWRDAHLSAPLPMLEPRIEVPAGLEDWLGGLLAKHPRDRFRRAADAAAALVDLPDAAPDAVAGREWHDLEDSATLVPESARTTLCVPRRSTSLATGRSAGPTTRAVLPAVWARPGAGPERDVRLLDAGLGLYGLRRLPVVGRHPERDQLWTLLHGVVEAKRGAAAVLRGPSGVGKTALARWLATRVHELGGSALTVRWQAEAGEGLRGAVRDALGLASAPHDQVVACLRDHRVEPHEALASWLQGEAAFDSPGARSAAIAGLLVALAESRPLVLVLDDVQYGVEGLALVSTLLERAEVPVLAVLTVGEEALADRPHEAFVLDTLELHPAVHRLPIGPLPRADRRTVVRSLLPLEPGLAARLDERTRGNPLFGVQLVADWVERGALVPGPEGFALREGVDVALPESLGAVWRERLDGLLQAHPDWERPLSVAAALGVEVDLREWRRACAALGTGIRRGLRSALLQSRLASDAGSGRLRFAHPMLREAVLERASDLPEVHLACAEVVGEGKGVSHRVGRHLAAGGRPDDAIERLMLGLVTLRSAGDYSGAWSMMQLWDQQVELAVPADDERRFEADVYAAATARLMGQQQVALTRSRAAIAWAAQHGDLGREGGGRSELSILLLDDADPQAVAESARATRLIREAGSDLLMLQRVRESLILDWGGDQAAALEAAREAVALAEAGGNPFARPATRMVLGNALIAAGKHDEASGHLDAAVRGFEERQRPLSVADCMSIRALSLLDQGRLDEVEDVLKQAIVPLRDAGSAMAGGPLAMLGHVLLDGGRLDEARDVLHEALKVSVSGHRVMDVASARLGLARLALAVGDGATARDQVDAVLALAEGRRAHHQLVAPTHQVAAALDDPERSARLRALCEQWQQPV